MNNGRSFSLSFSASLETQTSSQELLRTPSCAVEPVEKRRAMSDASAPTQEMKEEDVRKVNLVSMDGDSFEVSRGVAAMSELVKTLISGTQVIDQ